MKLTTLTAIATFMMASLVLSTVAEAKRVGGGSSRGMSRSSSYSNSNNYNNYNSAPARPAQATPAPARSGPNWGGVAAGVAVGAVGASLLTNSGAANANPTNQPTQPAQAENGAGAWNQSAQPQQNKFSWLWVFILAGGAYFIYRRFAAKKKALAANSDAQLSPFAFGNKTAQPTGSNTNIFGQPVASGSSAGSNTPSPFSGVASPFTSNGQTLADGTEKAAFLRQARATFLHMQTMNSASNLDELRHYFTPEMLSAVQSDIANNHDTAKFPQLNAQIVESTQENGQYVTSVLYSGTVSEELNAPPVPFSETWHFVKTIGSSDAKWLVAGIQQS
jgi:predicted lipid-binding transport protein (Tim44 family)